MYQREKERERKRERERERERKKRNLLNDILNCPIADRKLFKFNNVTSNNSMSVCSGT